MPYINPANSREWSTPVWLFDELDKEFGFQLDACAKPESAKCRRFYGLQEDALMQPWAASTFCNPSYGRLIPKWICKAAEEARLGKIIVMLLPSRTDTRWFHQYCLVPDVEVRFLKGRLYFGDGRDRAPFPSMIVIFRPSGRR